MSTNEERAKYVNPQQTWLDLHNTVMKKCSQPVKNFIETVIDKNQDEDLLKEMAYLLHMLTGDAAFSSVIPLSAHQVVTMACISLRFHNTLSDAHMKGVKKYTKEVPKLLHLAQLNDCVELITGFILELIDMTMYMRRTTHSLHLLPYLDLTTHLQEQLITFHQQENKCTECQICKSTALLQRRIMMITL